MHTVYAQRCCSGMRPMQYTGSAQSRVHMRAPLTFPEVLLPQSEVALDATFYGCTCESLLFR
jgi:hypothetical protein